MGAGHNHHHHHHHHGAGVQQSRRIAITLVLVISYMVAEVIGGLLSNSLALLADAGHMFSDAGALVLALVVMRIGRKPPSATHTFGYRRAEILGAMANGAALIAIAGYIGYEAITRLVAPTDVHGDMMLPIAAGGLVINLIGLMILHGGSEESLNMRAAWLHVLTDALGSVGAIVAALLIMLWGWHWADPAASLLIAGFVLYSAAALLKQTTTVLMQAVPDGISLAAVEKTLITLDGVIAAHDLHVWCVTGSEAVMSTHLTVSPGVDHAALIGTIHRRMRGEFNIRDTTIQLEQPASCPAQVTLPHVGEPAADAHR